MALTLLLPLSLDEAECLNNMQGYMYSTRPGFTPADVSMKFRGLGGNHAVAG